jgi:predicted dithiol-disulfide oxidoreductase (DUF899 family)
LRGARNKSLLNNLLWKWSDGGFGGGIMTASLHSVRFPGESDAYREARNELLESEITLRKQIEATAALRRALPLGGEIPEDYVFDEGAADLQDSQIARKTRLSELFRAGKDTMVVYNFMYGPEMKSACTSCTSMLDGLNGAAPHVNDRINLVAVAKSPLERIRTFARGRGWWNLRLLSSAGNSYNRDYQGESTEGNQRPALNIFSRRDGKIYHTYCAELMFAPPEPGQNQRHVDMIWPVWNMFDYTPQGRGTDWHPKLEYGAAAANVQLGGAAAKGGASR